MCGLFAGLLRARRAPLPRTGVMIQQRVTYIHGRLPRDNIGPAESAFALTMLTVALLGPSGWVLYHLDHYKSRD